MIYYPVIIIGGGPAGSSCARELHQHGLACLILDKQEFPRTKLCAGWITPDVLNDLRINAADYPFGLTKFNRFHIHLFGREMRVRVRQFAVRRYEFDDWLLKRSGVRVEKHEVRNIAREGDTIVIDGRYGCRYLVGAGGTHCPVYRTFFHQTHPRSKAALVTALEEEFPYEHQEHNCHLWFLANKLPGYSWYVPKSDGYVNIGIGGYLEKLKNNKDAIEKQWQLFTEELARRSLIKDHSFHPRGAVYYIRYNLKAPQIDTVFLAGDAAGLATQDMGEGIGPSVQSGLLVARAIVSGKPLSFHSIKKLSFPKTMTLFKIMSKVLPCKMG